ncbi:hypothetical protein [Verrucosispora sp. WMMC514]|uniref:hypothetical protein n=1 Tax=Verrucosispora sp. WMMC514 TaxID=3015156 RepID=UPI00248BC587|nr:hypothetical protein [Verrucosispora sp. WMMC514]WBB93414.1 hypothetical protein O7597_10760 [Verrucosispora sp. WMMC514]
MREEIRKRIGKIPEGFDFHFEPSADMLPAPLGSLRLDAVVTDGRTGVVYEIAVGRHSLQDERKVEKLRLLRNAIKKIPGWSFELIILPEPSPELLPLPEIERRVDEIETFLALVAEYPNNDALLGGMFLAGFAALESCVAMLASRSDIDYRPLAASLGAALTEEGVLSQEQLNQIRAHQDMRNRLAHGVRDTRATKNDVIELIGLIRELRCLLPAEEGTG